MARAIWTGVLTFGLVSVPVGLYSATEDHEVSFHQYEEGTEDRIRFKRVNERTDEEVEYADIVKGADVGAGHPVVVQQSELESVAPGRSRSLEIDTFVALADIDPLHFQKSYYLGPRGADTAKPYALLRDAMADADRAAIAKFVMRGKEYLAAIRADGRVLVLETLYFADEIRDAGTQIDDLPAATSAKARAGADWKMAVQLVETMTGPWRPTAYTDEYTERVKALVAAKQQGADLDLADEAPEATNVVDLVAVLRASVEAAKKRSSTGADKPASAKKSAAKKAPAKKSAVKKAPAKKNAAEKAATKKSAAKKSAAKKSASTKQTRKAS